MAAGQSQDRITYLLERTDQAAETGNLQEAFQWLKEASHLDAENAQVKNALVALQAREQTGDAPNLVRKYLERGNEDDGQKALQVLRQKQLPKAEAEDVLHVLLEATEARDLLDSLTGALIHKSIAARKWLAMKFSQPISEIFTQLLLRGEESFNAFATIPLDESAWPSEDAAKAAQADIFRLCIAELMAVDLVHPVRLMRIVARQLAIAPENVKDSIEGDLFGVIVSSLDIRLDDQLRSQAMLATSKILEAMKDKGEQLFGQYLAEKVANPTNDGLIAAFSAAAAVFPMIPSFAATLFLTEGFVQQLVPSLERNSETAGQGQRKRQVLEQAALELLSAACVDRSCREAIEKHCLSWLRDLSDERGGRHKALAALVLAKINSTSQADITAKLADLILIGDEERDQAVEGLAYTSLEAKVKEDIVSNERLLKQLIAALNERHSAAFGCLTIFSNLMSYRRTETAEQKKMAQLKAYANSQKPVADDPLDDDAHVTARARKLLDVDVVPAVVGCCRQTSSPTNIALVVRTLLDMAKEQKHRTKMVQQGAVRTLLQIRQRIAQTDKSTTEAAIIERNASHAIARLLISVNPAHVFSGNLSASSAVSALTPLLSIDQDSEQRDLLPTFEALLALTNLASMEDNSIRDLQIRNAWDQLEDLLFSSNTLVQRASVELVCNLMASPSGVAKFADGSNDAKRRMQILLALADVEDFATRRAAGGALAMLTEWDAAVTAILDKDRGVSVLVRMCEDDSDEMRHRGFASLANVVSAPGEVGQNGLGAVKAANASESLKEALRKTKNQEVLNLGVEVLKKVL